MNTSGAAYASIQPHIPSIKLKILEFIRSRAETGATREECQQCGLEHQSINGRLKELEKDLKIVDSGRVRQQKSERYAVVWVAAEFGPDPAETTPEFDGFDTTFDEEWSPSE